MRLRRYFGAHRLAHGVAVLQHVGEFEIAEAADGGVAHVGGQRTARVRVLKQEGHRIADEHLVPDADAHGGAFLRIHGLAAQVLLVDAHVQHIELSQPTHDGRFQSQLEEKDVQAGLVDYRDNFAEEDIHIALAFVDGGIESKKAQQPKQKRNDYEAGYEGDHSGKKYAHRLVSTTTCWAWLKSPSRTLRTYARRAPSPVRLRSFSWLARAVRG